jgi:hypothetical protein
VLVDGVLLAHGASAETLTVFEAFVGTGLANEVAAQGDDKGFGLDVVQTHGTPYRSLRLSAHLTNLIHEELRTRDLNELMLHQFWSVGAVQAD